MFYYKQFLLVIASDLKFIIGVLHVFPLKFNQFVSDIKND